MNLPTQSYQRYATSHALHGLHHTELQFFEKLVDFIINTLEEDYNYTTDSFPSAQEKENVEQRTMRTDMIQDWLEFLDEAVGVNWLERRVVKIDTLNSLFYAVWNIHWYPLSSTATISASLARPSNMDASIQPAAKDNEAFANILPAEILEYVLPKIGELQAARYGGVLTSQNDWVASMKESLREPIWHLSQKLHISREEYAFLALASSQRKTDFRHSLINIGGDINSHRRAIYLHIIWQRMMKVTFSYMLARLLTWQTGCKITTTPSIEQSIQVFTTTSGIPVLAIVRSLLS